MRRSPLIGLLGFVFGLSVAYAASAEPTAPSAVESTRVPLQVGQSSDGLGLPHCSIGLTVLENVPGSLVTMVGHPYAENPSAGRRPKLRPRLTGPLYDSDGKRIEINQTQESPVWEAANRFLLALVDRITTGWNDTVRAGSKDWRPEMMVSFILQVDSTKGTFTVESRSSPSGAQRLDQFQKFLESMDPNPVPEHLRSIFGAQFRLKLDYECSKPAPKDPPAHGN